MERQSSTGEVGIRVYTPTQSPSTTRKPTSTGRSVTLPAIRTSSAPPHPPHPPTPHPIAIPNRRRQAVAKGVQTTLSKTSSLAHFLPTGTLLTFEMVLPSIYHTGKCTPVSTTMMVTLLCLCTLSCFFFHFTDSFRSPDGKVFYGFLTTKGLAVFKAGLVEVPDDERYKLQVSDFVHAMMSVMVFVAIALSDHRVTACLLPKYTAEMEEAMESFPLMVGIVCSALFLVFPKTRRFGVGCMAT